MQLGNLFQATLYPHHAVLYCRADDDSIKNYFSMHAIMRNVWPWKLSTLENKSHEWLFPFPGGHTTG